MHAVGDLTGQLEHARAHGTDVDGHHDGLVGPVHRVEAGAVHLDELAVDVDRLVGEERAQRAEVLAHGGQRFAQRRAEFGGERLPPGPDPEEHSSGRQLVERLERDGHQADVAGLVVDDARADVDPLRPAGDDRGGDDAVARQSALGDPHRLEPHRLGVVGLRPGLLQAEALAHVDAQWELHVRSGARLGR